MVEAAIRGLMSLLGEYASEIWTGEAYVSVGIAKKNLQETP